MNSELKWLTQVGIEIGSRRLKIAKDDSPYEFAITPEVFKAYLENYEKPEVVVDKEFPSAPYYFVILDHPNIIVRVFSTVAHIEALNEGLSALSGFLKCALKNPITKIRTFEHFMKERKLIQ